MECRGQETGADPGLSVHAHSKTTSGNRRSAPNELCFWFFESAQRLPSGFYSWTLAVIATGDEMHTMRCGS